MSLRKVPIHRAGIRAHLFLDGDRELVLTTGLMCFTLVVTMQNLTFATWGIVTWFAALQGLRLMAKADPWMRHVFLRSKNYRDYYPARSTPWRDL